ncbi:MAG TPA: ATP-grasp domain-containing protein [Methylomirabilota bacterium]|nr:ATP-grasp domain-containing protein [Methylomirabilota bacterium]
MGELWIGVTGFYATDNPQPGLAVVRALRRADPSWRILALPYDRFDTGAFATDLIDAHAFVPRPRAGAGLLLDRFRALVRQQPLDVVIPTLDAELPHYVALRGALRRLGVRTCLPTSSALRAREKRRLPSLGPRAGMAVPETVVLRSGEAVHRLSSRVCYPQVLKGALVDSAVVHSAEDFRVAAAELAARWGYPLLSQPVIPGEEYDVAAVARRGELVGAAVMKKLGVTNKGTAWAGVTVEEGGLVEATRRLVRALRWDGALEAEFIRAVDGSTYCFEVNPRFPSWIALAADAGADLPAALVRLALGEEVEPLRAKPGHLFARAVVERVFRGNPLGALEGRGVRAGAVAVGGGAPAAVSPAPAGAGPAGAVAITGLNAADNPSPGLTVANALRLLPTPPRLIGLTHEILATGAYMEGVWDEVRLLPFPSREEGGYQRALVEHCREARADCLIPTLDIEIPLVARLAPALAAAGIGTLLPDPESLGAIAKPRLPALAVMGFRLPRTEALAGFGELPAVVGRLGMPFVIKGPFADARAVWTEEEARVIARRLAATWGFPLIAQEYIEGEEFGVAAVADPRHRVVGSVVVRKEIRTLNGNTWGGSVVEDRSLRALAERFAEALAWVGPFELEVIRHPRRGPLLIEVNPRFPAWVFLSAGAGANLPWAAVRLARGERVTPLTPRAGVFYVRMAWDAMAPVERMGALAVEGKVNDVAA